MIKHEDETSLLMLHATLQTERSKPTFPIVVTAFIALNPQ